MPRHTRRRLITTGIGLTTIGGLAGCTSGDAGSDGLTGSEPEAQSSFFVFGDFATHVAGDAATAETLVPIGQHGHGWEPGPDIQGTILESDLFVYGTEGFQPWVGDLITSLRDDGADVEMVPVGEGVDLIEGGHDHGGGDDHDEHEGESETPWEHAGLYHLEAGSYSYRFGEGPDPEMSLAVLTTDEGGDHGIERVEETARELYASEHETHTAVEDGDTLTPSRGSLYVLEFADSGETNVTFDIDADGHYVLFSQHVPAEFDATLTDSGGAVIEPEASETAGEHGHEDEHDHGAMDPHFWLDPQRAGQAVGTLEQTFAEMDGENAEVYADNAAAYRDRLEELDGEIQSIVDDAPKDTLFVAGHDAFQYLEDRYGLRIKSLTGLSPDDQPTSRDIERAQDIIDEHGLAHVCADPLEDQTAAEQLVEETDATGMLPLTAIPGQTSEWADNDWGYIEIMKNINLNALETALNA